MATRPEQLDRVLDCWQDFDFFAFHSDWGDPAWVDRENLDFVLPGRPQLPCLTGALRLPEGFFLTVAQDTIIVYHLLRWIVFLTEPKWQSVMFDALRWMCENFSARDCVVAHDCHPAVTCIRDGMPFEKALEYADQKCFGEVQSFAELYVAVESDSETAMKPAKGGLSQCVRWPKNKPLPPGWSRPTVWDSKGYWRFATPESCS